VRYLVSFFGFSAIASSAVASPIVATVGMNTSIALVDAATNTDTPLGNSPFITDSLAVDNSGTLYAANAGGVIFDISGFPIPIGPTGYAQIGDLDFANNGLWGFSNASQTLFFYDFGSSSVTYSASDASLSGYTITGVAFDPFSNSVYLSGNQGLNNDSLFNWQSNAASYVGAINHSDAFSYVSDIDFDASGNLYAMTWYHRDFRLVNKYSGATTPVSNGPHRDVNGMAILPVPEPTGLFPAGPGHLGDFAAKNQASVDCYQPLSPALDTGDWFETTEAN